MRFYRLIILIIFLSFPIRLLVADTNLSGFNVQHFRLTTDGSGSLSVYGSQTLGHLTPRFRLDTHIGSGFISAGNPVNNSVVDLVGTLWTTDLSFSLGILEFIDVGLQIPLNLYENGTDDRQNSFHTTSLGDIAFEGKVRGLPESDKIPGVAFQVRLTASTGDRGKFTGEGSVTSEFRAIVDKNLNRFYIAANLGYKIIDRHQLTNPATGRVWNIVDDDRLTFGLAARYRLPWQKDTWAINAQVVGESVLGESFKMMTPIEMDIGVQKELSKNFIVELGGGFGLTSAVGSPAYRIFAGLTYNFSPLKDKHVKKIEKDADAGNAQVLHTVNFKFDSAELSVKQKYLLTPVIKELMQMNPQKIILQGHTDLWGENVYNSDLSLQRAEEVKNYLIKQGFDGEKIVVESYGSTKPVSSEMSLEGQGINRRVDILLK
ncbi:MAG: OmpA family protein [Pseudomonadota bacterium]